MAIELPQDGYLALPLVFEGGRLRTCTLAESIDGWLRLNLNVPPQGVERPAWIVADPNVGCQVPHYDFQAVVLALSEHATTLRTGIGRTIELNEPRVARAEVLPVADKDAYAGSVTIALERVDGKTQTKEYSVVFAGSGPVFDEGSSSGSGQ